MDAVVNFYEDILEVNPYSSNNRLTNPGPNCGSAHTDIMTNLGIDYAGAGIADSDLHISVE